MTAEWLQDGHGPAPAKPVAARSPAPEKLKVLGMAQCGADGWSLWNGDVIDMIERPAGLDGVPNAYAVYVVGASMEPRYHPGEVVHIHPGRPVDVGAYVLVQRQRQGLGEPPLAVIKRLAKRTGAKITLEQFNPPKQLRHQGRRYRLHPPGGGEWRGVSMSFNLLTCHGRA